MAGGRDIIAIGASAGGIDAIREILAALPEDIPASIFIVLHLAQSVPSFKLFASTGQSDVLVRSLQRCSCLPVCSPVDGQAIERGEIYVGVPNSHLLVERGMIRLQDSPKESWHKPSVDALFRSAALAYGRRVVGVILSGMLHDGTAGLWEIKKRGGATIVQDPEEARHPQMPQSAIDNVAVDYCVSSLQIARKLIELAQDQPAPPPLRGPRSARVLIVEDERIVALDLERRLRELGYDVCGSASSGEVAFDLATSQTPDIILMDIQLPGIGGTEAAKRIWEQLQIPVIYVTAYADAATLDEIKTTEPYGYVLKPVRPAEVDAAIQLALDRRERENRGP